MSATLQTSTSVRTFTTNAPLAACRLRREDLQRLYRIINDRQIEYGKEVVSQLGQQPNESVEQFEARKERVGSAFYTTVNVTGRHNEIVSGSGEAFLAGENMPEEIVTVYYTTAAAPLAVGIGENLLRSKATMLLDFSRPTALDLGKMPSFGTENASSFQIISASETWFTALNTHVTRLFEDRRSGFDWLHKHGTYDLLLVVVGLPFALCLVYKLSATVERLGLSTFLTSAIYVYIFIFGLFVFRGLFSYSRWVFPKVEILSQQSQTFRHRARWGAIVGGVLIGVFGGAAWDAIKALL